MGYPIIMFEQQNATNIYTIRQEKFLKANNVRFLHLLLNIFYYFIINDDCVFVHSHLRHWEPSVFGHQCSDTMSRVLLTRTIILRQILNSIGGSAFMKISFTFSGE